MLENILLPLEIVEPHRSQFRSKKEEYRERGRALLDHAARALVDLLREVDRFPSDGLGGG